MRLKDRVCVVTGASSGIGAAVARRFAAEGGRVVLGARREPELVEVAKACPGGLAKRLDVADVASVTAFASDVRERYGRVDVLVNNAGVGFGDTVERSKVDEWDAQMAVNLRGAYLVTKAFLPLLLSERAWPRSILNVASVVGLEGAPGLSAYSASKAGLRAFTQSLAGELVPKGVRVCAINPGYVATPMVEDAEYPPETMIQPDELAELFVHLATLPPSMQIDEVTVWPAALYTE